MNLQCTAFKDSVYLSISNVPGTMLSIKIYAKISQRKKIKLRSVE